MDLKHWIYLYQITPCKYFGIMDGYNFDNAFGGTIKMWNGRKKLFFLPFQSCLYQYLLEMKTFEKLQNWYSTPHESDFQFFCHPKCTEDWITIHSVNHSNWVWPLSQISFSENYCLGEMSENFQFWGFLRILLEIYNGR